MITEKDFISYLERENPRFTFVIQDKEHLPSIEWLEKETALTYEQITTARYSYWQTLKDHNTLQLLLTAVRIYKRSVRNKVDLTEEILDQIKDKTQLPFSNMYLNSLRKYIDNELRIRDIQNLNQRGQKAYEEKIEKEKQEKLA